MAKEAKIVCDWMKRENKLLTFNMSEPPPPELEVARRFIRGRTLDVMISILQESSFPSSKVSGKSDKFCSCRISFKKKEPVEFLLAAAFCTSHVLESR